MTIVLDIMNTRRYNKHSRRRLTVLKDKLHLSKKVLLIATPVLVLAIAGAVYAGNRSVAPEPTHRVQSVTVEKDNQNNDVTVDTTPNDPVTAAVPTEEPTTTTTPPAPSPLAQFQQNVTTKVQDFAAYFVPAYAPDTTTFIDNQVRCASRGLDDSTDQGTFDAKLDYFTSTTKQNGATEYHFYTGGCQAVFTTR